MNKTIAIILLLVASFSFSENSTSPTEIIHKIIEQARRNEKEAEEYGFYLETNVKKLTSENTTKEEEKKRYRVTWMEDKPFLELLEINGKEPEGKDLKKEKERKEKFLKSLREKDKKQSDDEEDFSWDDLYQRFDFKSLPADETAPYVISFHPKKGKLPERNRTEKLLNHMSGTFWADSQHNLLRIDARLIDRVKYGLGLIARIDELHIQFTQQQHHQFWFPSTLFIKGRGQFALFKNERREIHTRYYDYYRKSQDQAQSSPSN